VNLEQGIKSTYQGIILAFQGIFDAKQDKSFSPIMNYHHSFLKGPSGRSPALPSTI